MFKADCFEKRFSGIEETFRGANLDAIERDFFVFIRVYLCPSAEGENVRTNGLCSTLGVILDSRKTV